MNKDIIVISQKEENIKKLKTIFDLIGYNLFIVDNINSAIKLIDKFIPLVICVVEEKNETIKNYPLQIKRFYPIIPILLLMNEKDHIKREEYIKCGYNYIIEFPWTEIELGSILNSIEIKIISKSKIKQKLTNKIYKKILKIVLILFLFSLTIIITINIIPQSKKYQYENKKYVKEIRIPSKSISGFFKKEDFIYVYDWIIQSFYVIDYKTGNIERIKNFFTPYIITSIKDSGSNFFFAITDEKEIKKILKDEKNTLISSVNYNDIKDICFDGMYIWILEKENLTKALNNDTMSIIEKFSLTEELKEANYISCNTKNISFYTHTRIIISSQENPTTIINSKSLSYIISSINEIDNKITITSPNKNYTLLREIN